MKDYLYNDNRILIRINSVLNFFANDSYFTLALFNCFIGFIGIYFLYRSFKYFFPGKEYFMLITLCFFPSLWFFSGAVLKEGITIFFLGASSMALKKIIEIPKEKKMIFVLILLIFVDALLKPYLLIFSTFCFAMFFYVKKKNFLHKRIIFFSSLLVFFSA